MVLSYLWRSHRRRLDAEQIRDSVLAFSGRLDPAPGGRHPFPHRLTYFYRQHEPFAENYPSHKRSVYLLQQRIQKNPYLDLFDGPDGNLSFADRKTTTTAQQALYFMNSAFAHENAEAMARRLLEKSDSTAARVARAYWTIFGRPPQQAEIARAERHLADATEALREAGSAGNPVELRAWSGYLRGMISSNAFMFID